MKTLATAGLMVCSLAMGIGGTLVYQDQQSSNAPQAKVASAEIINLKADLLIKGEPSLGSPNAPITIVEFSDFECPYCQRFHHETLPKLESEYINKGLVRFVHKDLPLPFHKNSTQAAKVARCSMEQDDYWLTYKALFTKQNCLNCHGALTIAQTAGLNVESLKECLKSGEVASIVNSNVSEAKLHGIRATPTFVIGPSQGDKHYGKIVSGAMPWPKFRLLVENALGKTLSKP